MNENENCKRRTPETTGPNGSQNPRIPDDKLELRQDFIPLIDGATLRGSLPFSDWAALTGPPAEYHHPLEAVERCGDPLKTPRCLDDRPRAEYILDRIVSAVPKRGSFTFYFYAEKYQNVSKRAACAQRAQKLAEQQIARLIERTEKESIRRRAST